MKVLFGSEEEKKKLLQTFADGSPAGNAKVLFKMLEEGTITGKEEDLSKPEMPKGNSVNVEDQGNAEEIL